MYDDPLYQYLPGLSCGYNMMFVHSGSGGVERSSYYLNLDCLSV